MGTITCLTYWKIQKARRQLEGRKPLVPELEQKIHAISSRLEAIRITLSGVRKEERHNVIDKDTGRIEEREK